MYFMAGARAIAHQDESRGDFYPTHITPRGYEVMISFLMLCDGCISISVMVLIWNGVLSRRVPVGLFGDACLTRGPSYLAKRGRGDKYSYEKILESISEGCGRCGDWRRATPPSVIPQITEIEMLTFARKIWVKNYVCGKILTLETR
jgi:hypothetical protein